MQRDDMPKMGEKRLKNIMDKIKNKLPWPGLYYVAFLIGTLGILMLIYAMSFFVAPRSSIGTVNITWLVDHYIKQASQKKLPPDTLKREVNAFGKALDQELKEFAKEKHVVLFLREAVIAGSHDYTKDIQDRLAGNHT